MSRPIPSLRVRQLSAAMALKHLRKGEVVEAAGLGASEGSLIFNGRFFDEAKLAAMERVVAEAPDLDAPTKAKKGGARERR